MDYKKAYKLLFQAITASIDQIEQSKVYSQPIENGLKILKASQQKTEDMYINE